MRKPHSKERKKFQKKYIDMLIHSMPIHKLVSEYKILTRMNLYRLSDREFIEMVGDMETIDGFHSVHQWQDFIEFYEYVEGKK
jgi:hypothetical protein|tara:strand:+ start:193 stop:441 length:249 start_codon:yes stop_codon:yes gene_type:complete